MQLKSQENSKWATLTLKEVERDTRVTIKHSYKGNSFLW